MAAWELGYDVVLWQNLLGEWLGFPTRSISFGGGSFWEHLFRGKWVDNFMTS
jgi:hypothetical protein